MEADDAVTALINDLRKYMRAELERALRQVMTGRPEPVLEPSTGRPIIDPFTGQVLTRPVLAHVTTIHAKLAAAGLCENREFREAMYELLLDAAAAPVFHLLGVLDGQTELPGNIQVELRLRDGERLPTHLHEILFPIDRDR
jgi:hypothetical protein